MFRVNPTDCTIFRRKTLTKKRNSCRMWLIVNISTIFREKCLTFIACSCIINANVVKRAKKRATARPKPNRGTIPVNQRINSSIAKKVTVDLLGHREMRACRASMPVVAPSRVPVRLDVQRGGFTPPYTHRR